MKTINQFHGAYAFLSNFYPCRIVYHGQEYMSAEAAFQAAKCKNKQDRVPFQTYSPAQAKAAGRKVDLRPEWEDVKELIMCGIITGKFLENPELVPLLLSTEDRLLVEENGWHDNYWGNCTCPKCKGIFGQNKLGKLLMHVRSELMITEKKTIVHPFFYEGRWRLNTGLFCRRCHRPVHKSDNPKYSYQCFYCDEDLFSFEVEDAAGLQQEPVMVARPVDGITINEALEYVLDDNGEVRIFPSRAEAESFLLENGFDKEDLEHIHFIKANDK